MVAYKEVIFAKADQLLFKEGDHVGAMSLYLEILEKDENNIEAINSVAYCVKFAAS